jgi:sugar/nucleoside kinase (ribokinase family)
MENNFDLLSIGEASVDVFINPTQSESLCKLSDKEALICFSYGDKIPVQNLDFSIGGNAANNAVGSSRLGVKTAIVLTLGDDPTGNEILEFLKKENVDTTYTFKQVQTGSNYSVIITYLGERTIFTYHFPRSYEYPINLPVTPWIYLTSMGENFKPFYNHIAEWLKKHPQIKMGFNPGSWQLRSVGDLNEILSLTHIIFVNKEEAQTLTNIKSQQNQEKELLTALKNLGPKIAVITDGENGAYAFDGEKYYKAPILPVTVHQRTGAGDAFGSGCLSALIKGKSLEEALVWGTLNSASVVGLVGSTKGLLHENEIQIWKSRYESSNLSVSTI